MKLYLQNHDDRYAIEQLQLALFPDEPMEPADRPAFSGDGAVSALHRGAVWLTAAARIRWHGKCARASCRLRVLRCAWRRPRFGACIYTCGRFEGPCGRFCEDFFGAVLQIPRDMDIFAAFGRASVRMSASSCVSCGQVEGELS